MTFEEFWKENYEKEFGTSEPYYGIASYAFEKGQENCNCVYTDNSNVIQKLEKENAKLKEQNKSYEQLIDTGSVTLMKDRLKNYKQLTKAKDIIKELVKGIRITFEHRGFITNVDAFLLKAEQFLNSEVEK